MWCNKCKVVGMLRCIAFFRSECCRICYPNCYPKCYPNSMPHAHCLNMLRMLHSTRAIVHTGSRHCCTCQETHVELLHMTHTGSRPCCPAAMLYALPAPAMNDDEASLSLSWSMRLHGHSQREQAVCLVPLGRQAMHPASLFQTSSTPWPLATNTGPCLATCGGHHGALPTCHRLPDHVALPL